MCGYDLRCRGVVIGGAYLGRGFMFRIKKGCGVICKRRGLKVVGGALVI